ncbi:PLP-dependent aminotransferase family protein [Micromonospora sp. NPDC005220]|uniref:aminotransferase-like domain-containing protein n=1 Tax=Micromonospora sp. NPDC005220 TaxID=3155589 RepID=UPI0033B27A78
MADPVTPRPRLATRMAGAPESAIGSVLRLGDRTDAISLAGGLPASEALIAAEVAAAMSEVLAGAANGLQYGETNGLPELREWLGRRLLTERGIAADAGGITVTHGSQQAIDLVCKVLLDPGDVVVVDRPSYLGALQVFRLFQADLRQVPLAADPDLAALEEALRAGLRPRLLYLVPSFANPTGATLGDGQRRRLAGLAERFDFVVVEDDAYGDLWLDDGGAPGPAIASHTDRAIHLGSLSKVLSPGIRVGYLHAPATLRQPLRLVRQASDLGNSDLLQRAVLILLTRDGYLDDRLGSLRARYRHRRDALATALRQHLPDAEFTVPAGGFFLWAGFAPGVDAGDLLPSALAQGVSFVPGEHFYVSTPDRAMARLSFSGLPPERADTAARRLAGALAARPRPSAAVTVSR